MTLFSIIFKRLIYHNRKFNKLQVGYKNKILWDLQLISLLNHAKFGWFVRFNACAQLTLFTICFLSNKFIIFYFKPSNLILFSKYSFHLSRWLSWLLRERKKNQKKLFHSVAFNGQVTNIDVMINLKIKSNLVFQNKISQP